MRKAPHNKPLPDPTPQMLLSQFRLPRGEGEVGHA